MKNIGCLLALSAVAVLSACGGGSNNNPPPPPAKTVVGTQAAGTASPFRGQAAGPNGVCTSQFVTDYNNLVLENQLMLGSGSDKEAAAHLKNLNTNCAQFFNNHSAADTCTGRVTYNGVSMTAPVTGATVKNICDQVSQTVLMTPTTTTRNQSKSQTKVSKTQSSMQQPTRTQATRQSSQPDTSASQAALTSIQANQLSLKIINPGDLALTNGSSDKYFQNGQVVSRNDLDYKGVFCKTMESSKGPAQGAQLAGQQILKNPESELKMSHVVVTTTDQTSHLSFLCATGSNSEISTADFKNTLKGAVAVSVR